MSQIDASQILTQMRALTSVAQSTTGAEGISVKPGSGEFGRLLSESIGQVNDTLKQTGELKAAFIRGEDGVDLPSVMVAVQEADISFQAMTQVRNRLLSAYQEIMSMPV